MFAENVRPSATCSSSGRPRCRRPTPMPVPARPRRPDPAVRPAVSASSGEGDPVGAVAAGPARAAGGTGGCWPPGCGGGDGRRPARARPRRRPASCRCRRGPRPRGRARLSPATCAVRAARCRRPDGALRADAAAGRRTSLCVRRGELLTDVRLVGRRLAGGSGRDSSRHRCGSPTPSRSRLLRPGSGVDVLAAGADRRRSAPRPGWSRPRRVLTVPRGRSAGFGAAARRGGTGGARDDVLDRRAARRCRGHRTALGRRCAADDSRPPSLPRWEPDIPTRRIR